VSTIHVSSNYFAALGIPVVRGRSFAEADAWPDSLNPIKKMVISLNVARALFGDRDPIGQVIDMPGRREFFRAEVVGVVGDVRTDFVGPVGRLVYQPVGDWPRLYSPTIMVKSNGPEGALTAVGVYGIVAYGVTTRTREFGIRAALGAVPANLIQVALRPAVTITIVGTLAGVAGALYLTKFIAASLYGVSRFDPWAFATAAAILAAAVLLASWLPARRAAKIDPMVALRYE
jgi:putative ABC transport system permease protein